MGDVRFSNLKLLDDPNEAALSYIDTVLESESEVEIFCLDDFFEFLFEVCDGFLKSFDILLGSSDAAEVDFCEAFFVCFVSLR